MKIETDDVKSALYQGQKISRHFWKRNYHIHKNHSIFAVYKKTFVSSKFNCFVYKDSSEKITFSFFNLFRKIHKAMVTQKIHEKIEIRSVNL